MSRRMVCPENGRMAFCKQCQKPTVHVRAELVPKGHPVPDCETHRVPLVAATP